MQKIYPNGLRQSKELVDRRVAANVAAAAN